MNGHQKSSFINVYAKPISAGLIAFGLDYATSNDDNLERKAIFGGLIAAGNLIGTMALERINIPQFIPNVDGYSGKQIEVKLLEIAGTFGSAYAIDYAFRNGLELQNYELMRKFTIVAAAEILSETLAEAIIMNT
jgi:hypothetical protein